MMRSTLTVALFWWIAVASVRATYAQGSSTTAALGDIFADDHIQPMSVTVDENWELPDSSGNFHALSDWVLPGPTHDTYRLNGWFQPITRTPSGAVCSAADLSRDKYVPAVNSGPFNGLVSPALRLVRAAQSTRQLANLRHRIQASVPVTANEQFNRATLLLLVDVARDDVDSARAVLDDIILLTPKLDVDTLRFRWPAYLMLRATISHPEMRRPVYEFFFSILTDLQGYSPEVELDILNDHLRTMQTLGGKLEQATPDEASQLPSGFDDQWAIFSYFDVGTTSRARPCALWTVEPGVATKLVGHEYDFLSLTVPLRGEFEIECDFSSTFGRSVAFMLAGQHLQVSHDGKSLLNGNARKSVQSTALKTPLTPLGAWSRYRATMREGVLTQFINGEPVQTRNPGANYDPWFAIRTWRRSKCAIRDLRITGNPEIPREVELTASANLDGWAPYFEHRIGTAGNWSGVQDDSGSVEIRGRARPELQGTAVEKLLRYYRPMLETGELTYEFFYKARSVAVHPAVDGLAFLMNPSGVGVHRISHRQFDRLGVGPTNVDIPNENQLHHGRLPLMENAWNKVTLLLAENELGIRLNDELVFRHELDETQERSFGFFHYADRTEARVRNVVWRGDWPTDLPKLKEQVLASRSLDDLESRVSGLQDVFHHDFRNGAPGEVFEFRDSGNADLIVQDDGIVVKQSSKGGSADVFVRVQLHGDFEVVATFDDLEVEMPQPRWDAGIGLRVTFDNPLKHRCALFRSTARKASNRRVQFYQSFYHPDRTRGHSGGYLVEESRSGRMRVVRIGTTLYGMYASGNSPHYRLISQQDTTPEATKSDGLSLALEGPATTEVSGLWKSLQIRAERISRPND